MDEDAVACIARQIGSNPTEYLAYDNHGRTAEYHRAQIREVFGFRPATVEDSEVLADWLLAEVAPREYDAERLKEAAYARLRTLKVEPPTPGRVDRLARSVLRRYDECFCRTTLARLSDNVLAEMDALLSEPDAPIVAADGADSGLSGKDLAPKHNAGSFGAPGTLVLDEVRGEGPNVLAQRYRKFTSRARTAVRSAWRCSTRGRTP